MSEINKLLITGCNGHIGLALTQKVSKDKKPVVIFRNQSTELTNLIKEKKVIPLQIDLVNIKKIEKSHQILNQIETIVHLAAFVPKKKDQDEFKQSIEQNLLATINLIENSPQCTHFIFASTCEVYGIPCQLPITENHPLNPKNIKLTILRLTNTYGPGETIQRAIPNFILNALQNKPPVIYGTGEDQRDFIYIEDAVNYIQEAIENKQEGVYNLASGQSKNITEIAEEICTHFNHNFTPIHQETSTKKIDYIFNIEKLIQKFKYHPKTTFKEGIQQEIEWFKKRKTLFFDLDGTLLNVFPRLYKVHQDIISSLNHSTTYTLEQYTKLKKEKIPETEIIKSILNPELIERYLAKREELIETEKYLLLDKISSKCFNKLTQLKTENWIVLITNRKNKENAINQLQQLNILPLFDEVYICNETETKYDAVTKSKFFNQNSIIIGDTEEEMQIGQKVGIKYIAITGGMRTTELLQQYHPNQLLPNISKIDSLDF